MQKTIVFSLISLSVLFLSISEIDAAAKFFPKPQSTQETYLVQAPHQILVGVFSRLEGEQSIPEVWHPMTFPGKSKTQYSLEFVENQTVMKAYSSKTASVLKRDMEVNPENFPILQWRWKISNLLRDADIKIGEGDDAPARMMVACRLPKKKRNFLKSAKKLTHLGTVGETLIETVKDKATSLYTGFDDETRVINYVWDNQYPVETIIQSPASKIIKYVVVETGDAHVGSWISMERDVYEDFNRAFGEYPVSIVSVGIMTDSDKSEQDVTTFFGDIFLKALSNETQ